MQKKETSTWRDSKESRSEKEWDVLECGKHMERERIEDKEVNIVEKVTNIMRSRSSSARKG